MDLIDYGSDGDSCIVDDVDLEECERPHEADLPPVNDLEFIASMAADFTYEYTTQPTSSLLATNNPSSTMEQSDDSDSDSSSDESDHQAPDEVKHISTQVATADQSSSSDSSDSEEEVITTKKGYQKASRQIVMLTEEEEDGGVSGPLKTKNEIEEVVEPVNPDLLTIGDTTTLVPIGEVKYRIDHECVVVIQADFTTSPLNEGSLLCNVDGKVLGKVQEVFGPITTPFYTARWKNPTPTPAAAGKNQTGGGKKGKGGKGKKGSNKQTEDQPAAPNADIAADPAVTAEPADGEAVNGKEEADEKCMEVEATSATAPTSDPAIVNTEAAAEDPKSQSDIPETKPVAVAAGLQISDVRALFPVGAKLFSAPQHCSYVLPGQLRQLKGSDASNAYDEEVRRILNWMCGFYVLFAACAGILTAGEFQCSVLKI
jgi:rRNA processing protein Gar1